MNNYDFCLVQQSSTNYTDYFFCLFCTPSFVNLPQTIVVLGTNLWHSMGRPNPDQTTVQTTVQSNTPDSLEPSHTMKPDSIVSAYAPLLIFGFPANMHLSMTVINAFTKEHHLVIPEQREVILLAQRTAHMHQFEDNLPLVGIMKRDACWNLSKHSSNPHWMCIYVVDKMGKCVNLECQHLSFPTDVKLVFKKKP